MSNVNLLKSSIQVDEGLRVAEESSVDGNGVHDKENLI